MNERISRAVEGGRRQSWVIGRGRPIALDALRVLPLVLAASVHAQLVAPQWSAASSPAVRADARASFGGRLAHGTETLGTPDGASATTWDTTALPDGWRTLTVGAATVEAAVLNKASIAVEGGRLQSDATWTSNVVHLLRNKVVVPGGVTLTVNAGTVIKLTENTGIIVEDGGTLDVKDNATNNVWFATAEDDGVGGDTDMRAEEAAAVTNAVHTFPSGTFRQNGYVVMRGAPVVVPEPLSLAVYDAQVSEASGMAYVPLTLSGTFETPFSVDWVAENGTATFGGDYTLASGTVSWTGTSQGTNYIQIPLVRDAATEGFEAFTVRLAPVAGLNLARDTATVTVFDSDFFTRGIGAALTEAPASPAVAVNALTTFEGRIAADSEALTYGSGWLGGTATSGAYRVRLTVQRQGEPAAVALFESQPGTAGVQLWNTAELTEGWYTLTHRFLGTGDVSAGALTAHLYVVRSVVVGRAYSQALPDAFAGAAKITVKGLPAGLKYNPKTGKIEGVPTKAGTFTVTFSATGVPAQTSTITVGALPAWAQGAFSGTVAGGGLATMTVSAAGKVTGKISAEGTNYAFTALSYVDGGSVAEGFTVAAVAKAGKAQLPLTLAVTQTAGLQSAARGQLAGTLGVALWRDAWKSEAATLAPVIGYYTATLPGNDECGSGYLTFTVDKAGKVKVGGKLADGTAASSSGTLILDDTGRVFAVVYTSPAAYKGGGLFGLAEFVDPAAGEVVLRPLDGEPFLWESRSPQATAIFGAGFAYEAGLTGGWYSKTANLAAYYAGKDLSVGTDAEAPAPELAVGTVRYDSIWWDPAGVALTPTLKSGVMTGLTAPAAGKPVDPDKDGVWDYGAANSVGLKCTLTRATGVFKGSFLAWFDYPVKKHVSKSLAFEGTLTPERENKADGIEGRGFFLWADKAVPPAPARPYSFNWSYDFLLLGE